MKMSAFDFSASETVFKLKINKWHSQHTKIGPIYPATYLLTLAPFIIVPEVCQFFTGQHSFKKRLCISFWGITFTAVQGHAVSSKQIQLYHFHLLLNQSPAVQLASSQTYSGLSEIPKNSIFGTIEIGKNRGGCSLKGYNVFLWTANVHILWLSKVIVLCISESKALILSLRIRSLEYTSAVIHQKLWILQKWASSFLTAHHHNKAIQCHKFYKELSKLTTRCSAIKITRDMSSGNTVHQL